MSHVDDGTLHTWLDGQLDDARVAEVQAHLEACAECRARSEHERALRDRADRVLRQIVPDAVRVEPFEQMVAARRRARAAGATGPAGPTGPSGGPGEAGERAGAANAGVSSEEASAGGRVRGRRFFVPLSLAATVMLAVTATWVARNVRPAGDDAAEATEREAAAPAADTPIVRGDFRSAEEAADPRTGQAASAPDRAAAPPVQLAAPPGASGRRAGDEARSTAADQTAEKVVAAAPPVLGARRDSAGLADSAARRAANAQQAAGIAAAAVDATVAAAPAEAAEALTDSMLARIAGAAWTPLTEADATRLLGRAPARIADLPVDSVLTADIDSLRFVRVVQQAAPGVPVDVLEWVVAPGPRPQQEADRAGLRRQLGAAVELRAREEAMAARVAPLAQRVSVPDRNILIRAALPPDSLAALAQRVR